MFNRGKSNQESSKEIGWNGRTGRFRDPIVERFPCLHGKERETGVGFSIESLLS